MFKVFKEITEFFSSTDKFMMIIAVLGVIFVACLGVSMVGTPTATQNTMGNNSYTISLDVTPTAIPYRYLGEVNAGFSSSYSNGLEVSFSSVTKGLDLGSSFANVEVYMSGKLIGSGSVIAGGSANYDNVKIDVVVVDTNLVVKVSIQ